jgi:hypothetical protein
MTKPLQRLGLFCAPVLAAALIFCAGEVSAASSFDGRWSVLVITEAGDCDRAYRYPVEIMNGRITYAGDVNIDLAGRVDRNGRLSASIRRADQSAKGSGRLSGNSGSGTWTGQSPTMQCSGRWEAERR